MALQGTLDTFELPDVLRLLASTRKSGRLHLRGDRGDGDVWLADGQVVGVEAGGVTDAASALFELLRAHEGAFAFEPGEGHASPTTPADVEPLLAAAEADLVEWRAIEAVVPSLDSWVALAPDLPGPEMTVDAATWRLVATIGSGLSVGELGEIVGLTEVEVSRLVRDVVALGLGAVSARPAHSAAGPFVAHEPEPQPHAHAEPATYEPDPVPEPLVYEPEPEPEPAPMPPAARFEVQAPVAYADLGPVLPAPPPVVESDDAEVARQLALLSPRAAEAVAAAAAATTDDERRAALEGVDDDEPVNRGLLLKFLSSVKS